MTGIYQSINDDDDDGSDDALLNYRIRFATLLWCDLICMNCNCNSSKQQVTFYASAYQKDQRHQRAVSWSHTSSEFHIEYDC